MIHSAFLRISVLAGSLVLAAACGKDEGSAPNPKAIRLTPNTGSSGDLITIEGMNFAPTRYSNEVKFGGKNTAIVSATADKLVVVVPPGVTTGKVEANTPSTSGGVYRTSAADFTVDAGRPLAGCGPRMNAATFTIGAKAYMVAGRHSNAVLKKDLWELDSQTKAWTRKADYPYGETEGAFAFSINGKGYVGGGNGYGPNSTFYEYDPAADAWTRKADLPVTVNAVTFVINGKGYVATGGDSNFGVGNKLMEYDPATNAWVARAPFPGPARSTAAGFTLNGKAYLGTGFGDKMNTLKDFYEYDPATNAWTRKADFAGGERSAPFGFAMGAKGFIGAGYQVQAGFLNDVWSYNPSTDQWQAESPLQAAPRSYAITFAFANSVFVLGGKNELFSLDDLRQYNQAL